MSAAYRQWWRLESKESGTTASGATETESVWLCANAGSEWGKRRKKKKKETRVREKAMERTERASTSKKEGEAKRVNTSSTVYRLAPPSRFSFVIGIQSVKKKRKIAKQPNEAQQRIPRDVMKRANEKKKRRKKKKTHSKITSRGNEIKCMAISTTIEWKTERQLAAKVTQCQKKNRIVEVFRFQMLCVLCWWKIACICNLSECW